MNVRRDSGGRVLVVCLPAVGEDLRSVRDYIADSLAVGVLALPEGSEVQVLDLPALNGVEVVRAGAVPGEPVQGAKPTGKGAAEKQAILERMRAYRQEHGLGCWEAVAKKVSGVSAEVLRDMASAQAAQPLAVWRKVGAALDRLEREQGHGQ